MSRTVQIKSPLSASHAEACFDNGSSEKMTFDEFRQRWRLLRDSNRNPALRYFNHQNDDFKFCVLTLVNRDWPGSFRQEDIGKPFECFDQLRRERIIMAMNKLARWGKILPRQFSTADCFLPE
ncbi:hypothetical protein [Pantoea stewartii]|uniref:hypothetical protein n=1 Tax=Pantoea stewartii TaxID=66269 RepID=UPI0033691386